MNEHEVREELAGRVLRTENYGDNAAELEFKALDKARRCFGEEARLEIVPNYQISFGSDEAEFFAAIHVRCLP